MRVGVPLSPKSPTAGQDTDYRHDLVYSSLVLASGATGTQSMFTVPKGQAIPNLRGAAIVTAAWPADYLLHSDLTTNLQKAGELGNGVGDIAIRGIGLNLAQATPTIDAVGAAAGYATYGATPTETNEIAHRCFFQLKLGQKTQTQGPVTVFPAVGGVTGSMGVSQTTNLNDTKLRGFAINGSLSGVGRRIRVPISVAKNDTLEGVIGTANGAALAFSVAISPGQPVLITCILDCAVFGEVR
jgi:hypothetical protein